jgi:DNA-binding NarL/FixJ family response regulator
MPDSIAKPHRILIAEDYSLMREGLRSLLESYGRFEVVGEAADGSEAVRECERLIPDLVLMDLSMPRMDGISAIREIKKRMPEVRVLAMTVHEAEEYVFAALKEGADGYVLKKARGEELVLAIESVLSGGFFVSPGIAGALIRGYLTARAAQAEASPLSRLTAREREVLKLLAEGQAIREIAGLLFVSPKTVEKHKSNLMRKLGVHSVRELRPLAVQAGLVAGEGRPAA